MVQIQIFTKVNENNYKLYKEVSCHKEEYAITQDLRRRARNKGFIGTYVSGDECGAFFFLRKGLRGLGGTVVEVRMCFGDELKRFKAQNKID